MAYTVEAAFNAFYESINLSGDHRSTANIRKDHLIELLSTKFEIMEAFGSGSIPRFTALKGHADVDIMVALHWTKHIKGKTPTQVLQNVRDALAFKTTVRKNGQAVTLFYETWPNVDIVPVARYSENNVITHYEVPDANHETWIQSRPKTHSNNIEAKAVECGENFRRIIKMVKCWNLSHGDYLQSYHIEVLALHTFVGNLDDTPWNISHFFTTAYRLLGAPIWHEGAYADAYLSHSDRQEILKRVETADAKSTLAWYSAASGNPRPSDKTAIELWKTMFGDQFPAYG